MKDLEAYRKRKRDYAKTTEQREKRRLYMQLWRSNNKEKYNKWAREYHHKNKHIWGSRTRGYRLKCTYHITEDDYNRMFKEQKGVCVICGNSPYIHGKNKISKVLHIDHDHSTGKIRGLLCSRCNGSLGWYEKFRDDINNYLIK